jgi:carbohydrate kinase (thermoresistant glucokinase family)
MIIIVMGVAGSGKTTIGSLLAHDLGWEFYDADDFHSESNRAKMSEGVALTDEDRAGWLLTLKELIVRNIHQNVSAVLACSALKDSYRNMLKVDEQVKFIYLYGTYEQIKKRLKDRTGHFMSAGMLDSQFQTLEEPQNELTIDISHTPQEIISIICKGLNL